MNAKRRELPLDERLGLVEDLASTGQEATVILRGGQTYHEPDHSYSIAPPISRGQRSRRCLADARLQCIGSSCGENRDCQPYRLMHAQAISLQAKRCRIEDLGY